MLGARLLALAAPAGFSLLAACLLAVGAVPAIELAWAVASVGLAFVPSAWPAPAGWRRRAAEAVLLPAAWALTMVGDPTMRRMVVPVLLMLAGWAAATSAGARLSGSQRAVSLAFLALAVRSATGLGLAGVPLATVVILLASTAALGWAAARLLGGQAGIVAALLVGAVPLQRWPVAAAIAAVVAVAMASSSRLSGQRLKLGQGWLPVLGAVGLICGSTGAWGGLPLRDALPGLTGWGAVVVVLALVVTARLPIALAGPLWLAATVALGPLQPAPPDVAGFDLQERATLPAGDGHPYLLELALANATGIAEGTQVATLQNQSESRALLAGVDAAEWAHERADVRARVGHPLPVTPVWRPTGMGREAFWGVAGRTVLAVPEGSAPSLARSLPDSVTIAVVTAGPSRPTPPRLWTLPLWILAAAVVVAALQLAMGRRPQAGAIVPWTLLLGLSIVAHMPVEPLHLLAERHSIDLALLAVLSAWLPTARSWLKEGRVLLAAAVPLLVIAAATPRLTPPMYGDEPFHLVVLDSLAHDWDLDLADNLDLEHHPYNRIYVTGNIFLHSPALALLLLPGYALLGRTGALALLALAGAGVVALVVRRAASLGVSRVRLRTLAVLMVVTYPLATFSSQIWVEVAGALAAAASLLMLVVTPRRRWAITAMAAVATAVKTRLALLSFPLAVLAWWPRRRSPKEVRKAVLAIGAAAAAGLAVGWVFLGHPLGYRRLIHLVPRHLDRAASVLGGLAFDPAGGLAFTAPLVLLCLLCAGMLWRRGGQGERALLLGLAATVFALLPTVEWYGGGSPPARYLIPALPAFALAGATLLSSARPWRPLASLLLPPAMISWWVLVTRPHFSINPGDGGYWLADSLARRFQGAARHLFPSFLKPSAATILVPAAIVLVALALVLASRWRPAFARAVARTGIALWMVAAAGLLLQLHARFDDVVEIEEPQVERIGGRPEPPEGTFSRFTYPGGWRVADQEGVEVPLHLPAGAHVVLRGWVEGAARGDGRLRVRWGDGEEHVIPLASATADGLRLPAPPEPGRERLRLVLEAPSGGEAVMDRLIVVP